MKLSENYSNSSALTAKHLMIRHIWCIFRELTCDCTMNPTKIGEMIPGSVPKVLVIPRMMEEN
jgi:hypothetical protein